MSYSKRHESLRLWFGLSLAHERLCVWHDASDGRTFRVGRRYGDRSAPVDAALARALILSGAAPCGDVELSLRVVEARARRDPA